MRCMPDGHVCSRSGASLFQITGNEVEATSDHVHSTDAPLPQLMVRGLTTQEVRSGGEVDRLGQPNNLVRSEIEL